MFGSTALEVGIGLVLVYLLLSLVCTSLNEVLAQMYDQRAKLLRLGVERMLGAAAGQFYAHPLIKSLSDGTRDPSYIPAWMFGRVLLDLHGEQKLPADGAARVLHTLLADAQGDLEKLRASIEVWYNDVMDRVSGWYKRWTQRSLFWLSLVVAFGANADTVLIVRSLSRNPVLRDAIVADASRFVGQQAARADTTSKPLVDAQRNIAALQSLDLPVGWTHDPKNDDTLDYHGSLSFPDDESYLTKIAGLLLTTFALMLGAPFWFDLLKRAINIRAAGKSPREVPRPPESAAGTDLRSTPDTGAPSTPAPTADAEPPETGLVPSA